MIATYDAGDLFVKFLPDRGWLQKKWLQEKRLEERFHAWCKDETSTKKTALTIALGLVLGVFPVIGIPTILCGFAAAVWRLNFPALQLVNYLAYPLQFLLLLPFARFGSFLFGVSLQLRGMAGFSLVALRTTAAWCCFAVPAVLICYFALHRLLRWQRARMMLVAVTPQAN